jgi:hypothetical protein
LSSDKKISRAEIRMAARYAVATRRVTEAEGPEGWRLLRELCGDLVELRRGDHSAERLRLEREQLELDRQRDREKTEQELWAWARENRDCICKDFMPPEERMARIRKVLFGDPPPNGAPCGAPQQTPFGEKGA